jgi:hypothetical protein
MSRASRDTGSTLAALRARRMRPAFLALLAWVLVAQAALVVHRTEHNAAGHNTTCAACVAADQSADASPPPIFAPVSDPPAPILVALAESAGTAVLHSYRSRAPPTLFRH